MVFFYKYSHVIHCDCSGSFAFKIFTDWLTGPLSNTDSFFVVADSYLSNLYQVDASSGATAQLLPFGVASAPIATTYDPVDKLIYWSDQDFYTINRYSLLTNSSTVIYRDPSNTGNDIT